MDIEPTINILNVETFKIWSFNSMGKKKGHATPCSRKTHFEILPFIQQATIILAILTKVASADAM